MMNHLMKIKLSSIVLTAVLLTGIIASSIRAGLLVTSREGAEYLNVTQKSLSNDKKLYDTVFGDIVDCNDEPIFSSNDLIIDTNIEYHSSYTYLLGNNAYNTGLLSNQYEVLTDKTYGTSNKGLNIRLTIDDHLQELAYSYVQGKRMSIVIGDKYSGKILAMAGSYEEPFTLCGVSNEQLEQYNSSEEPLWIPEYMNAYHTGSVMKLFTAAVGYDIGLGDFTVEDDGVTYFNGKMIANAYETVPKTENMSSAFVNSSNVFYSKLSVAIGEDTIKKYIDKFMLNSKIETDFGCITNTSGLKKHTNDYTIGSFGYGQEGYYNTVALCILTQAALTGRLYRPHVIDSVFYNSQDEQYTVSDTKEEVISQDIVSKETCVHTNELMEAAAKASGFPDDTGIKTGTAEIYMNGHNYNRATMIGTCYDKYIVAISEISDPESVLYGSTHKKTMRQIFDALASY